MQKKIAGDATVKTRAERSSFSVRMNEKQKIGRVSETRFGHTSHESVAIVNPIVHSDSIVCSGDTGRKDTSVEDFDEKSGDTMLVTEHEEVHTTPRITQEESRIEIVPRRRRQVGTVVWEPLLVPSEVDGKVEMVTALKRVDSDYVSSPRGNPRLAGVQVVKERNLPSSPRTDMQGSSGNIDPSVKVIPDTEVKYSIKKETHKKIPPDISEQMGKAIAEKEAAILKEIEKAMKEANVKTKLEMANPKASLRNKPFNEHSKSQMSVRVVPTQNVKKKNEPQEPAFTETDFLKDSSGTGEKEGAKLSPSPSVMTTIQNAPGILRNISSPAISAMIKEKQISGKMSAGKAATTSSIVAKPITKESQSINKILNMPGAVMVSASPSGVMTVPKDGQTKVLRTPGTVIPPTSTAVITAKDARVVNQVITLPIGTKSSAQTLKEMSKSGGPRIILLTTPTEGGLPVFTPFIPSTNVPALAPISSSKKNASKKSVEGPESVKEAENSKAKAGKSFKSPLSEIRSQDASEEIICNEGSNLLILATSHSESTTAMRQNEIPHDKQTSQDAKQSSKTFSLPSVSKEMKSSYEKNEDKNISSAPLTRSEMESKLLKNIKICKAPTSDINGRTTMTNSCTKHNSLQSIVKEALGVDCNGESVDVDDEFMTEELDQGTVNETDVLTKVAVSEDQCDEENKLNLKEHKHQKTPSKKAEKHKLSDPDSAEVSLEHRLQRIENLYNEIPPVKPRLSLTEEEFSDIRDNIRKSLYNIMGVSASFKNLINQSSLGCKRFSHPSSTNTIIENNGTDTPVIKPDLEEADSVLCRLCGGFFRKNTLVFLFGKLSKKKKLLSMLTTILPQIPPVIESDGLPQQICEVCMEKLIHCHSIIDQFLKADKELRHVLKKDQPAASETPCLVENDKTPHDRSEEIATASSADEIFSEEPQDHTSSKEVPNPGLPENGQHSPAQPRGEKRRREHHIVDEKRSSDDGSTVNHKHKRRRNKPPQGSATVQLAKSVEPSKSTTGCIDLSRLDPEYNDGFEVEWCLDEETIRSSLVPEAEGGTDLREESAVETVHVSVEADGTAEGVVSPPSGVKGFTEYPSDALESQTGTSEKMAKDRLESETPKHTDEVSKLPEMPPSVCETHLKSATKQTPVSVVRQEKHDTQLLFLSKSPETFKCSSCPLTFASKQEAFLHNVKEHEEEVAGMLCRSEGKQDKSNANESKNVQNPVSSVNSKKDENESCEESVMCDQCGLSFPNENSLSLHECTIHESSINTQLIVKESMGLEYKIVSSQEASEENEAFQEIPEASLSDGKILVKCGSGMLLVNSSKYFSEEQMAALQSTELSGVTYLNVENEAVGLTSLDQNIAKVSSPRNVTKVQFAYKCDHCKQIFSGKSELLSHLQTHLTEINCQECGAKFPSVKLLNSHIPSHIPADCVCSECGLILPDNKKLVQHKKEHTHNLPHVCESCGKRFPNEQTLEVHETVHYNKKGPLACSLCRKCFFFKYSLVRHRSQHASNRLQKCSLCFRVLNSSDQLRKHVALHQLMKNFVCFCKQTFPCQKELVEHRYLKHSYAEIFCARNKVEIIEPLPLHQCSVCLRVLNSKQSLLKHHVTSHTDTWPFYCIQCSRKYKSMFYLARHECHRKYTSAFQCRICGKAFQNRRIFKQHKVIHNNLKWRYICRHCGRAFQKSQSLVSHIMTHGGKKFLCPRCHQSCKDKGGLLKHYNNGSCQMKGKSLH